VASKSCLVTGGAGFIGSHVAERLLREGHRVRVVDNLSTGDERNIALLGGEVEFVRGDLRDSETCRRVCRGVELVFHLAALPSVPRSMADPWASHDHNVNATVQLLLAARDAGVRRLVYSSSSSVYGDTPVLPKVETLEPLPRSPYAAAKLAGEQYVLAWARAGMVEGVALRYFNVFGPRQDPSSPYSGVISLFISALCEDRRPTIYGDGEQTRDFTYVANVVDGVLRACHAPGASGEIINVATGGRISLKQLFETVKRKVGSQLEPVYSEPRAGDVRDSQADIGKAERLLGYTPSVSFDDGLGRTVAWYRESMVAGRKV